MHETLCYINCAANLKTLQSSKQTTTTAAYTSKWDTSESWNPWPSTLTLRVGGAADHVVQFGFQAGGGGAGLAEAFHAARSQRHHALQGRVGPQALALVDRQRCGVVDQQAAVLRTKARESPRPGLSLAFGIRKTEGDTLFFVLFFSWHKNKYK